MAGVKENTEIQWLQHWKIPEDFTPERIHIVENGFLLEDEEQKLIKLSNGSSVEIINEPRNVSSWLRFLKEGLFIKNKFMGILGSCKCLNGYITLQRAKTIGFLVIQIFKESGKTHQEINLNDFFADDFLREISVRESHIVAVEFTEDNMNFLTKFFNIDNNSTLVGKEIFLFTMGNTLNVLKKNDEEEWEVCMLKSFPVELKSLWYSSYFEAIFMISSLGVLQVSHVVDKILMEDAIFFGQKYLNTPKLIRDNQLIGISWNHLDLISIIKEKSFSISCQRILLPGAIDVTYNPQWRLYVAITENKLIYTFSEREKLTQEETMHEKWKKNRGKFKEHITKLMNNSLKMNQETGESDHILNCLGFIRNFYVANHEVTMKTSFRQTLGTNVELSITLSKEIVQMEFPENSAWSLCIFNNSWMQKFSLNHDKSSFDIMVPEHLLLESPMRAAISTEFSLDGEHFLISFPFQMSITVSDSISSSKPFMIYCSKRNALQTTKIEDFTSQWINIEQLSEKKLNTLALTLHKIISEEENPSLDIIKSIHTQLRSKDQDL